MNINEARLPAIIERDGTRFGFLSYNCVGRRGSGPLLINRDVLMYRSFHTTKQPLIPAALVMLHFRGAAEP